MMTKEVAYTRPLVCRMWALFGVHAAVHGYTPYGGLDCGGFGAKLAIPHVNVGPQGEYDKRWASARLLEFGAVPKDWDAQVGGVEREVWGASGFRVRGRVRMREPCRRTGMHR